MKFLLIAIGVFAILSASFALLGLLWMLTLALVGANIGYGDAILFGLLTKVLIGLFYLPAKFKVKAKAPSLPQNFAARLEDFRR